MENTRDSMRDVAVLVASLDRVLAGELLARLSPDQSTQVRRAVAAVGKVKDGEGLALVRRFRAARAGAPVEEHPGVVLEGALADRPQALATPAAAARVEGTAALGHEFGFLADADPRTFASFLARERPQTVAVVLSCLPPAQAANVLAVLPARMQIDVIRRLACLDMADDESLRVVAHELETWMQQQRRTGERRLAGLSAVAGIFAAAGPDEKRTLVDNLEAFDHDLARRVARPDGVTIRRLVPAPRPNPPRTFDCLGQLDHRTLNAVLHAAEPELVVLALAGASDELVAHVLAGLPQWEADRLRQNLDQLSPIRLSDVEAAQRELADLVLAVQATDETAPISNRPVMAA